MSGQTRWWALAALSLSMVTIGLDSTVLTVALPTLAVDLNATTAQLQWFSTAYTLVLAALLLPAGALGDRYGCKRLLLAALVIFGASSAWCAYSGSADMLILARVVLGAGAALILPLSMAVLPSIFPHAGERARAMTIWVTSTAVGLPLGPILGGWLLAHAWWGSIFLINLPLVVVAFAAVAVFVPPSPGVHTDRLDWAGVALSSAGLTGLTFGFIRAGQRSWTDPATLGAIAGALMLLAVFAAWQRTARFPLVDLHLFGSPGFRWGTLFAAAMGMPLFGVLFTLPLFFQSVQGVSTLGTGLRLLPLVGGLLVGTRVIGLVGAKLGAKLGDGRSIALGCAVTAGALAVGACTAAGTPYPVIAGWLGLVGVGLGMVLPTAMNAALGALSPTRTGSGSALIQALRQAGGTIGIALLGTVLNAGYRSVAPVVPDPAVQVRIDGSVSAGVAAARAGGSAELLAAVRSAFIHGMSSMLWMSAALTGVLAVVAAMVLRPPPTGRRGPRGERQSVYASH